MIRRILIAAMLVVGVLVSATPSRATCTTGRIEFDRESRRVIVELPECHPYE